MEWTKHNWAVAIMATALLFVSMDIRAADDMTDTGSDGYISYFYREVSSVKYHHYLQGLFETSSEAEAQRDMWVSSQSSYISGYLSSNYISNMIDTSEYGYYQAYKVSSGKYYHKIWVYPIDGVLPDNCQDIVTDITLYQGDCENCTDCSTAGNDTDGDGIEDAEDSCQSTPYEDNGLGSNLYGVDSTGCWDGTYNGESITCSNIPTDFVDNGSATYDNCDCDHSYSETIDGQTVELYCDCDCIDDADGDGVEDASDLCSSTASGAAVDDDGCSCEQGGDDTEICGESGCCSGDSDGDGIYNENDQCSGTASGAAVDSDGCSCEQGGDDTEICGSSGCCDGPAQEGDVPTADEIGQAVEYYMQGHIPSAEAIGQAVADNLPDNDYETVMDGYRAEDQAEAENAENSLQGYSMPTIDDFQTDVSETELTEANPGAITDQSWYTDFTQNNGFTGALSASAIQTDSAACSITVNLPKYGDVQLSMCGLETALSNFGTLIFLPVVTLGCLVMVIRG